MLTFENYRDFFDINLVGENGKNQDREKCVRNITFNTKGKIHQIKVECNLRGRVFPFGNNGLIDCPEGTSQTVSIEPEPGYRIKKVIVDGIEVPRIQVKQFNNVTEKHSVTVEFEKGNDYFNL